MVLLDAIARRLPGALAAGSGELESFSAALDGGLEYPHYTRPPAFRGWGVPRSCSSGDHARVDDWRSAEPCAERGSREDTVTDHYGTLGVIRVPTGAEIARRSTGRAHGLERRAHPRAAGGVSDAERPLPASGVRQRALDRLAFQAEPVQEPEPPRKRSRNPVDRLTEGLPHGLRVTIDWIVTIVGAVAIVLAVKAWVVNPYRIPSSSMEPTLHCATPADGCLGSLLRSGARKPVHLSAPRRERGEIVVFQTPPRRAVVRHRRHLSSSGWSVSPASRSLCATISGSRTVVIDGRPLDEPYIAPNLGTARSSRRPRFPWGGTS